MNRHGSTETAVNTQTVVGGTNAAERHAEKTLRTFGTIVDGHVNRLFTQTTSPSWIPGNEDVVKSDNSSVNGRVFPDKSIAVVTVRLRS